MPSFDYQNKKIKQEILEEKKLYCSKLEFWTYFFHLNIPVQMWTVPNPKHEGE